MNKFRNINYSKNILFVILSDLLGNIRQVLISNDGNRTASADKEKFVLNLSPQLVYIGLTKYIVFSQSLVVTKTLYLVNCSKSRLIKADKIVAQEKSISVYFLKTLNYSR